MNKSMFLPVSRVHVLRRSLSGRIGVNVCAPSSWSHCRRTKLSTIDTSCPLDERYNAVAQPQYPSPPRTITLIRFPLNALSVEMGPCGCHDPLHHSPIGENRSSA